MKLLKYAKTFYSDIIASPGEGDAVDWDDNFLELIIG